MQRCGGIRKGLALIILLSFGLVGCQQPPWPVNDTALESKNYNSRVRLIVIHYTSGNFASSAAALTGENSASVSSHYLIPAKMDTSFRAKKYEVFQLVPDAMRAWHAGFSYWQGMTSLNDNSIGIEITNRSRCENIGKHDEVCSELAYQSEQIEALINLLQQLEERHGQIDPTCYVGHSDIATARKRDPGALFPWHQLYEAGFGAWPDALTVARYQAEFHNELPPLMVLQSQLNTYGYEIDPTGLDDQQSRNAVTAFQQHFMPTSVDGTFDSETAAILFALIDKYR